MYNKEEASKKLRFYDRNFLVLLISIVLLILLTNLFKDYYWLNFAITLIGIAIPSILITFGMLSHMARRQSWGLFFITILLGGWIISFIYYFAVIRSELKKVKINN